MRAPARIAATGRAAMGAACLAACGATGSTGFVAATRAAAVSPQRSAAVVDAPVVRGAQGARLDSIVGEASKQGFHGVVLVAQKGETILLQGYGIACETSASRFQPSTVVQIGSGVKDYTKVAILQLVEAGRLQLTDPVSRFFPSAPADKRSISVQQLMEHRAGLPHAVGRDEEPLSREQFLERVFTRPLEFALGTGMQYSNPGYSLLAAIVEEATGEAFDAYVAQAVLAPLRLHETGLMLPRFSPNRLAHGYAAGEDRGAMFDKPHSAAGHDWNLRGNGGWLSTVGEQLRFYRALRDTTLLRDADHRAMVLDPERPSVLAGSDQVCFFLFGNFPQQGVEIVLASNHADWKAEKLMPRLLPALGIETRRAGAPERGAGAAPAGLPDTRAGRTVAAYIEAFNSGDAAVMRRFFEQHAEAGPSAPPLEKRVERYQSMYGEMGRFTVESVLETTAALEVTVQGEHGPHATFGFQVQATEPFKLRGVRVDVGD